MSCLCARQDDVQWACPACSAKVEAAEMSAPQLKPKRERKDGKKRQRASIAAGTAESSSPRAGAGNSFPTPKAKEGKRSKAAKEGAGLKSPKVKREDDGAEREVRAPGGNRSANRMVTAPRKASISPRVGLGLTDAKEEMSAVRHADLSGSHNNDRSPSKSMMSLAVAAASVAASEAAIAAAVAAASAAAAPQSAAPPKALGLKKLLHQRVQHDEANLNPAFSPKKLLKHRLLAAQQTAATSTTPTSESAPSPVPPYSSSSVGRGDSYNGGGGNYAGHVGYRGEGNGREVAAGEGRRHANGGTEEQSGFCGRYTSDSNRRGVPYGGGEDGVYDGRQRAAAEGNSNGRVVGDGGECSRHRASGAMNGGGDHRDYNGHHNHPGREGRGVNNDANFCGGGGTDRAGLGGEQRREAQLDSGGCDAGRKSVASVNREHAGGGGWSKTGGSEEGRGRFAKDVNGGASDKWVGGGGPKRVDAPRLHGHTPAFHGQERRREPEVRAVGMTSRRDRPPQENQGISPVLVCSRWRLVG